MTKLLRDLGIAAKISAQARDYGKGLCKEGAKHLDIAEKVEAKIRELGGKPSFPVDISVNNMAAHLQEEYKTLPFSGRWVQHLQKES